MNRASRSAVERALALFGPLESRIMRTAWGGSVGEVFVVHDVQAQMPELAYTTVMSTMVRLAQKGLLISEHHKGVRAHQYRVMRTPETYLEEASRREVEEVSRRFGDAAVAAFEAHLGELTREQRQRLRRLGRR